MSSSLSKVIGMGMALTLTAACGGHKQESSMKFDDQTAKTLSVYEAKNELTKDQIRKICSLSNLNIFIGNAEPIGEIMFAENADQSFKEKLTLKTQRNSQRLNEATLFLTLPNQALVVPDEALPDGVTPEGLLARISEWKTA